MRSAILVLSVATLTCPAVALAKVTADPAFFTEATAGIVCVSGVSTSEAAPGTRLGYIDTVRGEIVMGLAADRIPAIPGLSFGVISQVADTAGAAGVTMIVTHPPMGPEGSTRDTWQRDFFGGNPNASFFQFDFPEELVTGDWTMQAVLGDRVLLFSRFQVVDPGAMPGFVNPCREPPPIS